MSALSAALLIFQFLIQSAFLPYIGPAAPALWRTIGFIIRNIGHRTLPKILIGRPTFPVRSEQPSGKTLN